MKKIKLTNKIYSQYKSINEDTSTGTAGAAFELQIPENILKPIEDSIEQEIYNDNIFVRVKMTKNFYDAMSFPTACTELNRLVEFVDFPGYLKDLGGRLDSDPKINIKYAPDYAAAAFANTEFNIFAASPLKETHESVSYNSNSVLNEDVLPTMTQVGQTAGELGVMIGQGVADGISGFASTVGPAIGNAAASAAPTIGLGIAGLWGAGYATGTAIGTLSSDQNPNRFTNDKQYDIDYTAIPEESKTTSNDPTVAIDDYIRNIQASVSKLLSYITARSARQEISDLEKTINTLTGKANKSIEQFIRDNNETFKEKQELERQQETINANRKAEMAQIKAHIWAILGRNNLVSQYTSELKKIDSMKLIELQALEKRLQEYDRAPSRKTTDESIKNINLFFNQLNESDAIASSDNGKYLIFNADPIYDDIKTTLTEKVIKILSTDPEDWESIKWARKEMDVMQEGADKEILAKIDIICRTGNVEQMGLGAKLGAFIHKHPMRAEYLKGLWGRYMRDLDVRKQKRIDNMTTPDNASPLGMCTSFLKNTYPSLIAMMITYKAIIKLVTDVRVQNKYVDIIEDPDKQASQKQQQIKAISTKLEASFRGEGIYLAVKNNNGNPIYDDEKHVFTVAPNILTRFGLFMSQFSPERSLTKDNIDKYGLDFINMVNLIVPNDTNATQNFFTRFIAFLNNFGNTNALQKCNIDPYFINLNANQELVKIIDLLDNITAIKNKVDNDSFFSKLVNNSLTESDKNKFCYLLAYIRSTRGLFLSNYEKLKSQILGLEVKDKNDKDLKSIREQLHIDGDISSSISTTIDDIKAELPWDSLKYILGYNFNDSYILSALLYYKLGLYECDKFNNEFNTNINYSLIKTFIELLGDNFNKVTMLFDDDATMFELEHFRNEYMGTNGAIDAKGLYDLLHIFTNTDKKDLSDYQAYAQTIDKQLKSTNPIVPSGENIKANNINSFNDIITLFGFDSHKIKSIDGFIQNLKKDNLKDLDIEKCSIVFKEYLGQVIKKFDEDFDKQDLSAFEKFVGNVDDNSPIEKETIFVGYDSNDNAAHVSLSQFLSIYSEVVSYALNDSNVKTNLTKLTNDIDAEIKKTFKQKTGLEFNFNFVNINDGLFVQMSKKDMTPGNIKGIIDTLEVTSNRQVYKANTDMLVKNSLLNFLPDIFNLPIMTRFVNIMFGNENGKIYKYQKS